MRTRYRLPLFRDKVPAAAIPSLAELGPCAALGGKAQDGLGKHRRFG